jgi:hypothetical protein
MLTPTSPRDQIEAWLKTMVYHELDALAQQQHQERQRGQERHAVIRLQPPCGMFTGNEHIDCICIIPFAYGHAFILFGKAIVQVVSDNGQEEGIKSDTHMTISTPSLWSTESRTSSAPIYLLTITDGIQQIYLFMQEADNRPARFQYLTPTSTTSQV